MTAKMGFSSNEVRSLFRTVLDFFFDTNCIVKIFGSVENATATRGSDVDCGFVLSREIFEKYKAKALNASSLGPKGERIEALSESTFTDLLSLVDYCLGSC